MSQKCCPTEGGSAPPGQTGRLTLPGFWDLLRLIGAGAAALVVWFNLIPSPEAVRAIGLAAVVVCGYPIFRAALTGLINRRMNMELSMTIALIAAVAVNEVLTTLVIVFSVLLAEEIEKLTLRRGRSTIEKLLNLLPQTALLKQGADVTEVALSTVKAGDIVVVKPGMRLAVDGVVVSGTSYVDEATITGESFPREKTIGSRVYAGTINQAGALEVKTERIGADTAFGKIVAAVEEAENTRADIQKTADRFAGYLVYFAIAAAGLTWVITGDIHQTISVIIVAGACGIAAGTPLAILGSIGRAAQIGSVVKGGLYLERLALVDTVVFDKTGTLTHGKPHVVDVVPASGVTVETVLSEAATAETLSEHPLAKAILSRASADGLSVASAKGFAAIPGRGITCRNENDDELLVGNRAFLKERSVAGIDALPRRAGASEVLVAKGQMFLGAIYIADAVRPEAKEAIRLFKEMRIHPILLSGDASPVVEAVAKELGIEEYVAEMTPGQKREHILKLQSAGRVTAMIGDGVNDAPALVEAAVGVAIGSGTDVAVESADVVLIGNDLVRFVETVQIARQCRTVIYTNFVGTIAVDAVGMVLAAMGMLNPLLAALIHVGSEIVFLFNSARLFPIFQLGLGMRRRAEKHSQCADQNSTTE